VVGTDEIFGDLAPQLADRVLAANGKGVLVMSELTARTTIRVIVVITDTATVVFVAI
jgi:hypothetical protein